MKLTKVEFEYVEGKDVARLVGIFPKEKLLNLSDRYVLENILQIRNAISNVTNFIKRTVVGETPNDKLYESFLSGLAAVQNPPVANARAPLERGASAMQVRKLCTCALGPLFKEASERSEVWEILQHLNFYLYS